MTSAWLKDIFRGKTNQNYKKFVLLGHARTGTNLLRSYLNGHPELYCFGEIFNEQQSVAWKNENKTYSKNKSDEQIENHRRNNVTDFLNQFVYGPQSHSIKAVGFKLFYYHAREGSWKQLWDHLKSLGTDLHIIHLEREHIFKILVSLEVARKTNQWAKTKEQSSQIDKRITLPVKTCRDFFIKQAQYKKEIPDYFPKSQWISLTYENLAKHPNEEMQKIWDALEVKSYPLQTKLKKQNKEPLDQLVVNYAELKDAFDDTEWGYLF